MEFKEAVGLTEEQKNPKTKQLLETKIEVKSGEEK